jgi:hypothetical protein
MINTPVEVIIQQTALFDRVVAKRAIDFSIRL